MQSTLYKLFQVVFGGDSQHELPRPVCDDGEGVVVVEEELQLLQRRVRCHGLVDAPPSEPRIVTPHRVSGLDGSLLQAPAQPGHVHVAQERPVAAGDDGQLRVVAPIAQPNGPVHAHARGDALRWGEVEVLHRGKAIPGLLLCRRDNHAQQQRRRRRALGGQSEGGQAKDEQRRSGGGGAACKSW